MEDQKILMGYGRQGNPKGVWLYGRPENPDGAWKTRKS